VTGGLRRAHRGGGKDLKKQDYLRKETDTKICRDEQGRAKPSTRGKGGTWQIHASRHEEVDFQLKGEGGKAVWGFQQFFPEEEFR